MSDEYLQQILAREAVNTGIFSPVRGVQTIIQPILQQWAGNQLSNVSPSGSFAKGTANRSGTDIDLFISLSSTTTNTLKEIYETLFKCMQDAGYTPKRQNVSINVRVGATTSILCRENGRTPPAKITAFIDAAPACGRRRTCRRTSITSSAAADSPKLAS
jgi:hypothetical protein